jgi:hypothetical protein
MKTIHAIAHAPVDLSMPRSKGNLQATPTSA